MANFHPLWSPPTKNELEKGERAIGIAKSLPTSRREADYIEAIATFYTNWQSKTHKARCLNFEKAMESIYGKYRDDEEAAVFYALALNAAADPTDKTYFKQKKAAAILNRIYYSEPNHPGVVHYLIHSYDYPGMAKHGLAAARRYISVAPSSAHALHMPSHIFTRLGYWDESISANKMSIEAARCYAAAAGIKGNWDEELHALDYLTYAYLQKGDNHSARLQVSYLRSVRNVSPMNFKVAYAFAAIPSRYLIENRLWQEAATLEMDASPVPWKDFPWQKAIIHFTRLLGSIHIDNLAGARTELRELRVLYDTLLARGDEHKAAYVSVQVKSGEAWLCFKEGNKVRADVLMREAAEIEDGTEKHPVTPGEVVPARELLADMQLSLGLAKEALVSFQKSLEKSPRRFNALYGAAVAARASGEIEKARYYFKAVLQTAAGHSARPEIRVSRTALLSLTSG